MFLGIGHDDDDPLVIVMSLASETST